MAISEMNYTGAGESVDFGNAPDIRTSGTLSEVSASSYRANVSITKTPKTILLLYTMSSTPDVIFGYIYQNGKAWAIGHWGATEISTSAPTQFIISANNVSFGSNQPYKYDIAIWY